MPVVMCICKYHLCLADTDHIQDVPFKLVFEEPILHTTSQTIYILLLIGTIVAIPWPWLTKSQQLAWLSSNIKCCTNMYHYTVWLFRVLY